MTEEGNKSFMKYTIGKLAEGDQSIGPDQSEKSRTANSNADITKPNIKCKDLLEHFQNANSNNGKTTDCTKLSDFKGSKVLNSLKMSLEGTLNCVNFVRQRVHENILAKTNEKHNFRFLFEKPMSHCSQKTNDIDLKSADIPKDNSLYHIDEIANDSNLINKENEQTTTDKINYHLNEITNSDLTDYSILSTFPEKEIKSINQPNSLSGINCDSQEKLIMISLLSDDEEFESDSNNISASCIDGGNNKTSLTSQEEHSINTESNLAHNEIRAEKNGLNEVNHPQSSKAQGKISGEFGKQSVKKKKNDSEISGLHLDSISDSATSLTSRDECQRKADNNTMFAQNECREEKNNVNGNQQRTVEKRIKSPEKRSDEFDRQHVKKKRIIEVDGISCQPRVFDFCGVFYKVKLTNLHPRINYGHIASLLHKADLDFVDILLVNSGSYRSFAEISFTDSATREKAVSLDKTLSHLGMKIKIKAI